MRMVGAVLGLFVFFGLIYTTVAVAMAVAMIVWLALIMAIGLSTGQAGFAASAVGGSGLVVVILLVASVLLLYLAGRSCCATSIMAARKSVNLFAATAESWRLTWEAEWRIIGYLTLIGLGLTLVGIVAGLAIGYGLIQSGSAAIASGLIGDLIWTAISAPIAYLIVLVQAGIYRELAAPAPADIFA
jgi:hypothetical protein